MVSRMTDDRPSEVLGGLPRTRPHRRSEKRGAPAQHLAADAPTGAAPTPPAATAPTPPAATAPAGKPVTRKPAAPKTATGGSASVEPLGPARKASGTAAQRHAARTKPARLPQPEQPAGAPPAPASRRPVPSSGVDILGTAVQAAAELTEIGLSASARALRGAISRLPRP
jgi:hypothetical protein